jgi:hypothetical protein
MELIIGGVTAPVALAAVALLGYLVGRGSRPRQPQTHGAPTETSDRGVDEARALLEQVEVISNQLRRRMAKHHRVLRRQRDQVRRLSEPHVSDGDLTPHARFSEVLDPADQLTHDIATAYDELRQHAIAVARLRSQRSGNEPSGTG